MNPPPKETIPMPGDETTRVEWKQETCSACRGHGVVSDYGGGNDFYGPKECDACWGSGAIWRSPNDRLAVYPGGPFVGFDPRPKEAV